MVFFALLCVLRIKKQTSKVTVQPFIYSLIRALEISNALVYNLLRKVYRMCYPIALSKNYIKFEIASTWASGMLFLFIIMIIYVR